MELDIESLQKLASQTGARARAEADLYKGSIVYMNEKGQMVQEKFNRSIEILKEAESEKELDL